MCDGINAGDLGLEDNDGITAEDLGLSPGEGITAEDLGLDKQNSRLLNEIAITDTVRAVCFEYEGSRFTKSVSM